MSVTKLKALPVHSIILAATLVVASVIGGGLTSIPELMLYNESGQKIAEVAIPDGVFVHHYIHSIHQTPVDEEFSIKAGRLELTRVRYDTYGVGMPSDGGESFRIEDNRFVVDLRRSFERIDIRVSFVKDHGLIIGDTLHAFTDWVAAESLVTLRPGFRYTLDFRRKAHL